MNVSWRNTQNSNLIKSGQAIYYAIYHACILYIYIYIYIKYIYIYIHIYIYIKYIYIYIYRYTYIYIYIYREREREREREMVKFVQIWNWFLPAPYFPSTTKHLGNIRLNAAFTCLLIYNLKNFWTNWIITFKKI